MDHAPSGPDTVNCRRLYDPGLHNSFADGGRRTDPKGQDMTAPYLEIDGLRKVYRDVVATDRVDLTIAEGEFMTFLGPSGSGKSTTLYILAGFQDPTAGDVRLRGQSILSTPSHRRNIGMVFQRYSLFPHLTVAENVAFPLRIRRTARPEMAERVARALALVRLTGFDDRMPAQMSGGQQQRVALARALVYNPPVLLMDEPLSALDRKLREEIQHEIRRIHAETGVTILYVTHDQEEALRLSDRVAVFNNGRIEQVGTGESLYSVPSTRFVAEFMGDSAVLSGTVAQILADSAMIRLPDGTLVGPIALHGNAPDGATVDLLLRPERVAVATADRPGIATTAIDVVFLGNGTSVTCRTAWGEAFTVRLPWGHELIGSILPGMALSLRIPRDSAHAFPR
ncbi:MAG: ABC transporter ATP-binding protein [Rubellimicrobium sp.]|nr:ABC transporter ATP-binding protein [Rubellimicrobium sp.]